MIILTRSDPEENLERWYAVTVQPTLLNEHAVTCFWGRRDGSYQQQQTFPTESLEEAQKLAKKKIAEKMKRGYRYYSDHLFELREPKGSCTFGSGLNSNSFDD